ncbi:MAG: prepilin-type N-terminal cleavage/methylation domain-containing protein [Mariprofundaceae bacterium]|nr:prepilin-type N-terminal cleavage/methylation domain-containing protein [Mariprofundaceae bacterium]
MNNVNQHSGQELRHEGFTLIELLVTIVIAMIILGGLLVSFSSQNTEYKYQNKRIDAVQDLEFSIRFIADDLRNSLFSAAIQPAESAGFIGVGATTALTFWVWETDGLVTGVDPVTKRAQRKYVWKNTAKSLRYDRVVNTNVAGTIVARADNTGTASGEILPNVTFFKVFKDNVDLPSRASFLNIPAPMQALTIKDSGGNSITVPGYTILIEVEVMAGYKKGVFKDVKNNTTTTKRIWRYVQVYPQAAAS